MCGIVYLQQLIQNQSCKSLQRRSVFETFALAQTNKCFDSLVVKVFTTQNSFVKTKKKYLQPWPYSQVFGLVLKNNFDKHTKKLGSGSWPIEGKYSMYQTDMTWYMFFVSWGCLQLLRGHSNDTWHSRGRGRSTQCHTVLFTFCNTVFFVLWKWKGQKYVKYYLNDP